MLEEFRAAVIGHDEGLSFLLVKVRGAALFWTAEPKVQFGDGRNFSMNQAALIDPVGTFLSLPCDQKWALLVLALEARSYSPASLAERLARFPKQGLIPLGELPDQTEKTLKGLARKGLVVEESNYYGCHPELSEPISRYWLAAHPAGDWLPKIQNPGSIVSHYYPYSQESIIRFCWYTGNDNLFLRFLNHWEEGDLFHQSYARFLYRFLFAPWSESWFLQGKEAVRNVFLRIVLENALAFAWPISPAEKQLQALSNAGQCSEADWVLWNLLTHGSWARAAETNPQSSLSPLQDALLHLWQGNRSLGLEFLQTYQHIHRKRQGSARALDWPYQDLLELMWFLSESHRSGRLLQDWVKRGLKAEKWLSSLLQFHLDPASYQPSRRTNSPWLFSNFLGCLYMYWSEKLAEEAHFEKLVNSVLERAKTAGFQWLVAQANDLRERSSGRVPEPGSHQPYPWSQWLPRKSNWERLLESLQVYGGVQESPSAAPQDVTRIAWILVEDSKHDSINLEVRKQKRGKLGWTKGQQLPLNKLKTMETSGLAERDRRMLQFLERDNRSSYFWDAFKLDRALLGLVEHPYVFRATDPNHPVDVVQKEICLTLRKTSGGARLVLEPQVPDPTAESVFVWETRTRLAVYPITPMIRNMAKILHSGVDIPFQGLNSAAKTLLQLRTVLPIASDLEVQHQDLETIEANAQIHLQLVPFEQGVNLSFVVQPLADGPLFTPGKGNETVIGPLQGKTVLVMRNRHAEQTAMKQMVESLPILQEAEMIREGEWSLPDLETSLEFLVALGDMAERPPVLWPKGKPLSVARMPEESRVSLQVRSSRDWFHLDGELRLDENQVLTIRALLAHTIASKSRFISLGENQFVALTKGVQRHLTELSYLVDRVDKEGLRINKTAALALDHLVAEAGHSQGDEAWARQRRLLQEAFQLSIDPPKTLLAELREYQAQGFLWMARMSHWGAGVCLADDMGLGKTIQALALLLWRAPRGPALVVAPTSVCHNWFLESSRFAPSLRLRMYHQDRDLQSLGPNDVVVTSYGLMHADCSRFKEISWSTLILDEAQAIKNFQAKRAQAARSLNADFRLALTGTPVENHLGELWSLMSFLNPGLLGSLERFNQRFARPIEQNESQIRVQLRRIIQPFLLRRSKAEVLAELPAKIEITYPVELSEAERNGYEALRQNALETCAQAPSKGQDPRFQILAEITRLRRFCCHPSIVIPDFPSEGSKLEAFGRIAADLVDNRHKALVFSQFVDVLTLARGVLDRAGYSYQYLDGTTPVSVRQKAVHAFQRGESDFFLISLKAGGFGLNLTAADYVIHLDPWWNPAVEDQATDRTHRIGQRRPVTVYRLVAVNTIEEKIVSLHAQKRALAEGLLLESDSATRLQVDDLRELLIGV